MSIVIVGAGPNLGRAIAQRFGRGGAAIHPHPLRAGVGISFAGEVAYARMLHDEVRDKGIHVAHTAVASSGAGVKGSPARPHTPQRSTA